MSLDQKLSAALAEPRERFADISVTHKGRVYYSPMLSTVANVMYWISHPVNRPELATQYRQPR